MIDSNGQELKEGDLVAMVCEVVAVAGEDDDNGIRIRILNSEQELLVTASHDEVHGWVASSELMKLMLPPNLEAMREAQELGVDQIG